MKCIVGFSKVLIIAILAAFFCDALTSVAAPAEDNSSIVKSEFIFEQAPFRSCDAPTIVETRDGLLAAWFGGTREQALDVAIWMARYDGKEWSTPFEIANGADDAKRVRYPCSNPVLYQTKKGPLLLFYKVGRSPESWWGMLTSSENSGRTWSVPKRLPSGILGPAKNKPIELTENLLLCGSSTETAGWRVHLERSRSFGQQWTRTPPINSSLDFGAIEPAILAHESGALQILCRTKQGVISESWSNDGGDTWSRMMATDLPNPNSGIDAVVLRDGRIVLAYNHSADARSVLNLALSPDGKKWISALVLENESGSEFSNPSIIQSNDGMVHITYTWKSQRIKHVLIDPFKFPTREQLARP